MLRNVRVDFAYIDRELDAATAKDIGLLTNLATKLRKFIWVLVVISIVLLVVGYFVYKRYLLTPIGKVSRAMKAHALGDEGVVIPEFSLKEISDLGNAFNQMNEKVQDRQLRLKNILDNAAEGIITINDKGLIQSFNLAAELMFGFREYEVLGENISIIMLPEDEKTALRAAAL